MSKSFVPAPRQTRAKETVAKLIAATESAIRDGGESAVRIQEISEATGVSIGSIYHHFGDRDGLIRATYAHNYAAVIEADVPLVRGFLDSISTTVQLADRYEEMLAFVRAHAKNQSGLDRASIIGTTANRPKMREALAKVQHELNSQVAEVMEIAAQRGLLKSHLSPRAAGAVMLGLLLGRAVAELDSEPMDDDEWSKAALSAAGGMFNGPSHSELLRSQKLD